MIYFHSVIKAVLLSHLGGIVSQSVSDLVQHIGYDFAFEKSQADDGSTVKFIVACENGGRVE